MQSQTPYPALRTLRDELIPDAETPVVEPVQRHPRRVWVIVFGFCLIISVIVWRLLDYQLFGWGDAPADNVIYELPAPRGVIVDAHGQLLAGDRFFYDIAATPNLIVGPEERAEVGSILEQLVGISAAETERILTEAADQPYTRIGKGATYEIAQKIVDWKRDFPEQAVALNHIYLEPLPKRYYPQGALASQLIGFVGIGSERTAHYGIEKYYDLFLRGNGVGLTSHTEETLDVLPNEVRTFVPSAAGKDLVLTIDRGVQWIIEEELAKAVAFYQAHSGTIIVMDPHTGAVLGMANWPTYDPNFYGQADQETFANPAVSAQYEPGSIFKVITFATALDAKLITPDMPFNDTGSIIVGGREILNSDLSAWGQVSATEALAHSLNVVTAEIATMVEADQFYRYVRRFGFGAATEIDLANEVPGLLKAPGVAEWSESDLGTNSFGQGVAVTPIQMINSVAAIANHGVLLRPYIVQDRIYDNNVLETNPTVVHSVIRPETAETLTEMMVKVVEIGNKAAQVPGYRVAGKSGTAQIPVEGGYSEDETIASFIGFAPADDPQFVMLIKLDRPNAQIAQWASQSAAPVFSLVARRLFSYMNIPPDDVRLAAQAP